jgi:hypothetical protein
MPSNKLPCSTDACLAGVIAWANLEREPILGAMDQSASLLSPVYRRQLRHDYRRFSCGNGMTAIQDFLVLGTSLTVMSTVPSHLRHLNKYLLRQDLLKELGYKVRLGICYLIKNHI